jgi:hypothetical protein
MTHQRKTIRDAIVSMLDDGSIVASGKVFSNRSLKVWKQELPVLNVFTSSETAEPYELCNGQLDRTLIVVIEATASDVDDESIDDVLDALAEEIENKLDADPTLSGSVVDSILTQTEISSSSEGDRPTGSITLTYNARYIF